MTDNFTDVNRVCDLYGLADNRAIEKLTNGHINNTYNVTITNGSIKRYIVQHINSHVFPDPSIIMENIRAVSEWVDTHGGGECAVLHFLNIPNGANYTVLDNSGFWRIADYAENTVTHETIENAAMMNRTGAAFGAFHKQLSDMPLDRLRCTIPDFHNTKKRLNDFFAKVKEDPCGRVKDISEDIAFFADNAAYFSKLEELRESGVLPERVVHNDTKCNNVLFDAVTGEPHTIIDLDTVMPGLAAYDFGDAVRCAANYAEEDETDLGKVGLNMEYFDAFSAGFIGIAKSFLTPDEAKYMALGAPTIAFELASRFLADYIDGDNYFRIHHPNHNLERARCQSALCRDMMSKQSKMDEIVMGYYNQA